MRWRGRYYQTNTSWLEGKTKESEEIEAFTDVSEVALSGSDPVGGMWEDGKPLPLSGS